MKKYAYLAAFIILLIPVVWIVLLKNVRITAHRLPIYGERFYDSKKGDTIYHQISPFTFIDQLGDTITEKDFEDAVYVANFFFASCKDICPAMMKNLQVIYDDFKESPNIKFISHTVDPARDSVSVLAQYGASLGAVPKSWFLVTGSKEDLYYAGEYDYLLATIEEPLKDAFLHSEQIVLVDKNRRIRGYYDGTDYGRVKELKDDIKALLAEYKDGN